MEKYKLELKWGGLFMLATLVWMLLERVVGLHTTHIDKHPIFSNLFALVAITIYVFALREKRSKDFQGSMSWKEGFISGVIISVVLAILSPLGQVITHYVVSPEYFSNVIAYSVENSLHTQVEAEAYFSLKNYIIQSTVFAPVMGILTSAVVAFFLSRKSSTIPETTA